MCSTSQMVKFVGLVVDAAAIPGARPASMYRVPTWLEREFVARRRLIMGWFCTFENRWLRGRSLWRGWTSSKLGFRLSPTWYGIRICCRWTLRSWTIFETIQWTGCTAYRCGPACSRRACRGTGRARMCTCRPPRPPSGRRPKPSRPPACAVAG